MYTAPLPFLPVFYMNQVKHIRLDKLKPPEWDSRLTPDQESDDDLRDSIRELGVLLPLLVKETSDGLEIVAGNRRYIEAGRVGLASVPCVVIKTTGAEADKIKLHENLKRLPLSHVDQAYSFAHLIKEYDMTETQISILIGKSIGYVSQHLSLLQCDEILVQAVHDGRINFSVARELVQCKDPDERARLREFVEKNGATSDVVHNWVQESNRETDHVDSQVTTHQSVTHSSESQIALYPCAGCGIPKPLIEMKLVKFCPDCHYLIFSEIEREKFKLRSQSPSGTPEPT